MRDILKDKELDAFGATFQNKYEHIINLVKVYDPATKELSTYKPTLPQWAIIGSILEETNNRVQVISSTQYGKLIADSTPVLTSKGWTTHGKLKVGDYVFSPSGKQIKVKWVGGKALASIDVEFTNGEIIKVHPNHEWTVIDTKDNKLKTKETKEFLTEDLFYDKYRFKLPNVEKLQFKKRKLIMNPYVLGVWLGDGSSSKPTITMCEEDNDVIKKISKIYTISTKNVHKTSGVISTNFWRTDFKNHLKKLKVLNDKHIPEVYIKSSTKQRLELLAGLIDSDGSVYQKNGRITYSTCSAKIRDGVVDLLATLGMRSSVVAIQPTLSSGGIQGRKVVYAIGFNPTLAIPTVLERKKINRLSKNRRIGIKSVKISKKPEIGNCIEVNSKDGLYLVGKKLIPTHNSLSVGISAMISAVMLGDKIAIVAPSTDKAKIIMDVAIDHLDDNPVFAEAVKLDKGDTIERIKKYRQKTRLSFSSGGEIRVYSADARNKQATIVSMMGFGARKVLVDESSLIDDDLYSTIKRMVGGYPDGFLFEIGNPFINNHFRRTWEGNRYLKLFVDYKKALAENRYTKEFIDEMKDEEFFSVLYECKFPELDETRQIGTYKLLSPYVHLNLTTEKYNIEPNAILGVDVARAGSDSTVFVKRGNNYARVVWRKKRTKLDDIAMMIVRFIKGGVPAQNVFIDETGLGGYLVDFLTERGYNVVGVNFNAKSSDEDRFINMRAEMYREMKFWIDDKINSKKKCLVGSPALWRALSYLTYSFVRGKMKMTSKDELKTLNKGKSPDVVDALALTFAYPRTIYIPEKEKSITEKIWEADMEKLKRERAKREQDPIEMI